MIIFNCPVCGEKMEAPEELRGQSLLCPTCGEPVGVHGINVPLTPDSHTCHTDLPIYATPRKIPVISISIIGIFALLYYQIHINNWENRNSKQIINLCQQVTYLLEQDQLDSGIRKYMELEEFIADRVITKSDNTQQIDLARNSFEMTARYIHWNTLEIAYYSQAIASLKSISQKQPTKWTVQKANKEYQISDPDDQLPIIDKLIIGKWLNPKQYGNGEIVITQENELYFLIQQPGSGKLNKIAIEKTNSALPGTCFIETGENLWGIMYRINENNDLEIWDKSGYISTASKIIAPE
ncbi:MAG: hypothetical protein JW745_02190 [Sedimentisphaerales bacterium]|nr:hypothetical protein [Sedimentisphaerales bacterium]MBN2842666.1 hypothetical protein [Sedimentisphaerales bacterium]